MVNFILSPAWFIGIDAGFETVTMAVAALIALTSLKFYRLSNMKKYYYFGMAFGLLATAFATKENINKLVEQNIEVLKVLEKPIVFYDLNK